jgi:multiple sugar transport system substrate-binding protein
MSRTRLGAVALVASGALLLAACSGGTSGTGTSSAPGGSDASQAPAEKVTITYSNFISNGGNEDNLTKIVDAFEAENPGITVDVKTLPYADYFTALQTDVAGGTTADVFDIEYATYASLSKAGVLAELPGVDAAAYKPSLLEAYQTDGTQYALPSSFSTVVLFYDKDLFDAKKIAYPTADWTWADEKAAAQQLTDSAAGVWGDYQPISYNEFYKVVAQAGGTFLSDDGTKAAFNTPEGLAAANWLIEKSGTVMPTAEQGAGTPDFDSTLFHDGKLAMWHTGIWMFGANADATFGWDVAVEPGDTQHASALFSNAVAVSAGSKNKEAAQTFAEYLTTSKTMVDTRLAAGWELPPVADESLLSAYLTQAKPANRQAVFDSLDATVLAPSIGDNQNQMQDVVTEKLTEAAAGRLSVQDALNQAEAEVNALLG